MGRKGRRSRARGSVSAMATEAELMRAVLLDPDSDEPRRAYMRWAAERGDTRGDFIRVQLELAEMHRRGASVYEWAPLFDAAEAHVKQSGALWRLPLEDLVIDHLVTKLRFRRGFVEDVTMDAAAFENEAPRVYAVAPIRMVSLRDIMKAPRALASPHMVRIRSLDISAIGVDDEAIGILAGSPYSRGLRWLDISKNKIGREGLEAIAGSAHLKGLRYVNFVGNRDKNPIDEFSHEGMSILYSHESERGRELEAKYGRLEWLHAPTLYPDAFPPDPDAFVL
jgi:uncharacterized protein (TIGR02996 family)